VVVAQVADWVLPKVGVIQVQALHRLEARQDADLVEGTQQIVGKIDLLQVGKILQPVRHLSSQPNPANASSDFKCELKKMPEQTKIKNARIKCLVDQVGGQVQVLEALQLLNAFDGDDAVGVQREQPQVDEVLEILQLGDPVVVQEQVADDAKPNH